MALELGTNLQVCSDWDTERLPADLVWGARPWATGNGNGIASEEASDVLVWCPIDTAGWPISSVSFGAVFESAPWPGTYKLTFKTRSGTSGQGAVSQGYGNITLTFTDYNSTTNVTSYDVTVGTYAQDSNLWLMWSGETGGITDVHLMRPLKDESGWHAIGTPLSDHIIDRLKWFTTIRPMQTQGGQAGHAVGHDSVWENRTSPWGPQTRARAGPLTRSVLYGATYADKPVLGGVAIENMIAMSNQSGTHLWICVPYNADDDYITKMAQAIRYGTDGYDPYTSTQASPVFAPLASNLNVYVEYANEVWNPSIGYWIFESKRDASDSINNRGDPYHLTYAAVEGGDITDEYSFRLTAYQAVRISLLFRAVFGDAAMMTRVRPLLAGQHGNINTINQGINYINAVWGETNAYGHTGHPTAYYLYGIAVAPYCPSGEDAVDTSSVDGMIGSALADLANTNYWYPVPQMTRMSDIAVANGINLLAYEGGDNLPVLAGSTATRYAASADARMGANILGTGLPASDQTGYVYGRLFKEWSDRGGGLFAHFSLGGACGLSPPSAQSSSDPRLETGPKWDAVKAYAAQLNPGTTSIAARLRKHH